MDKRYQIFVSSTYTDLKDERYKVMLAIMQMKHQPAGMELFTSGSEMPWDVIEREIKQADYYILIIGGRYGSTSKDNDLSYTEREFDLARSNGVPILAFLHGDPGSIPAGKTETNDDARKKLEAFRRKVLGTVTCRTYENGDQLAGNVVLSLMREIELRPRTGWVPGNQARDLGLETEARKLKSEVERLTAELGKLSREGPSHSNLYAFGSSTPALSFYADIPRFAEQLPNGRWNVDDFEKTSVWLDRTWNELYRLMAPLALIPCPDSTLNGSLLNSAMARMKMSPEPKERFAVNIEIPQETFAQIKIQFLAKGLWDVTTSRTNLAEAAWTLTPYGQRVLVDLVAKKASDKLD